MRVFSFIFLLCGLAVSSAMGADYVITALENPKMPGYNYEFEGYEKTYAYTSNIAIPPVPTIDDNISMYGFYDLKYGTNLEANVLNFYSSGAYGNATSWYGNAIITARELNIYYKDTGNPIDMVNVIQNYSNSVTLSVGSF